MGQNWVPNTWIVNKGDDAQLMVHLLDVNGVPINISGASAINLLIVNADKSILSVPALAGIAVGMGSPFWVYTFLLTAAQTALLPIAAKANVEIQVLWGTNSQKFLVQSSLTVAAPTI